MDLTNMGVVELSVLITSAQIEIKKRFEEPKFEVFHIRRGFSNTWCKTCKDADKLFLSFLSDVKIGVNCTRIEVTLVGIPKSEYESRPDVWHD